MRRKHSTSLPELRELEQLGNALEGLSKSWSLTTLRTVHHGGESLPLYALQLGTTEPQAPVLMCIGGVHGLERIGAQVVLGFIETLIARLRWDRSLDELLGAVRLCFLPVLNPWGVLLRRRSNGNGVDLMRNAPVSSCEAESPLKLHRGHRWSNRLPWFRGADGVLEAETEALCEFVQRQGKASRFMIALDVHSGFVGSDRIWFPYARTRTLFPDIAEMLSLKKLLDATYPKHRYIVEPQATQYTAHGDVWDYLYDTFKVNNANGMFLPLTLELGTASWLKRNWRVPSKLAFFHPLEPALTRRVLRRHIQLFEFLQRVVYSWERWARLEPGQRTALAGEAQEMWRKTA